MKQVIVGLAAESRTTAKAARGISHHTVEVVERLATAFTNLLNTGAEPMEIVAKIADLPGIEQESLKVMVIAANVHVIE